jgi:phage terminase Nu1 subunit (DNA packaging protein)
LDVLIEPDHVDANELALWLGITPTAVRDAARRGVLEKSKQSFRLRESIQKYCAHLRKLVVGRSEGPAAPARARLANAQAEHAEMKTRVLAGALLEAETVKAEWCRIATLIRARVLAVPSRLQQTAPHLTATDIEALDHELREALSELADQE